MLAIGDRRHGLKPLCIRIPILALGCLSVWTLMLRDAAAQEPAPETLSAQVDRLIAGGTPEYAQAAAPLASDAEFLRRVSLDFTGSIPPVAVAREFLADADPDKRAKLVDRLVASPEFARQMQRVFDLALMQRRPAKYVPLAEWQTYLRTSFAQNKPWDQLAGEILSSDGTDPQLRAPSRFFLDREGEVNEITRDVGRIFLGVNLECAQCHNHPQVEDWKQRHYYGISAFLNRSVVFKEKDKSVLAEKADGEVTFESVFEIRDKTSPGPQTTFPRFFDGMPLVDPKFDFGQEYVVVPAKDVRGIPNYSRRAFLGEAITNPENRLFRRAIANRLWSMLMGRGLIHPLDYDHSENPPSHPELLDLLAENLAARKYDMRGYLRDLALTQTYQRSSRIEKATHETVPAEDRFAVAILKPLMPEQFALALMEATGFTNTHRTALGPKATEDALHQRLAGLENQFIGLFGGQPGMPQKDFDASIEQALFLANDAAVQSLLSPNAQNLTARLAQLPPENVAAIADELYISVLTRPPVEEEVREVEQYLADRGSDRPVALQELVWALVTSAEFRFNH